MDISQASPTLNHAFSWSAADLSLVNTFNVLKNSWGCTFKSITSQGELSLPKHTHTHTESCTFQHIFLQHNKPTQAQNPCKTIPIHAGTNKRTIGAHRPVSQDPPKEMQESTVTQLHTVLLHNKIDQIEKKKTAAGWSEIMLANTASFFFFYSFYCQHTHQSVFQDLGQTL